MKAIITIAALSFGMAVASAQSLKPYWTIETNVNKKDYTILRVYDQQNNLLHEETISGKAMTVTVKRDRKKLNKKVKEILDNEALASGKKWK